MNGTQAPSTRPTQLGALLQFWRRARRLSQLALATQAEVSPRHISFLETGRASPSREMVLRLASTLDVPLRERNELLLAAGYAPVYPQSPMEAPGLAAVRGALDAILRQQEPYPAVVMNRAWDVLLTNEAASRFFGFLVGESSSPANVLRMMFDPAAVRPFVRNWDEVARTLMRRVCREAVGGMPNESTKQLLADLSAYPGVPAAFDPEETQDPLVPVIPVRFEKDGRRFNFFSTVTTLGTPQDITVQEIRIECFFPIDDATRRAARDLAAPG